ncbi:MAG: hypothetical protein GY781_15230 [Gammaproteobacteria bacterium]|nr:hypothetical protein [Gammaproteobacteria bacterium]
MSKRYRTPKPKDGELRLQYGKLPHNEPDHIYLCGKGTSKWDARLVNNMMFSKNESGSTFADELEARGYDLETLKFSISKRVE